MSTDPKLLPQEEATPADELVAFAAPTRVEPLAASAPEYSSFNGGGAPRE